MRIVQFLALGLIGYLAYEVYEGIVPRRAKQSAGGGGPVRDEHGRFVSRAHETPENLAPTRRTGRRVTANDSDGGSTTHSVGRGVVRR